jgi:neural Wiskott-Aldrich syndrome protein
MAEPFSAALPKISTSQHLSQALDRAHRLALDQRQGAVTLEHLLYALTEDAEAGVVFDASQVNLDRLRNDINGYLSRLPAMPTQGADGSVRPNPDFLRILQAAAAAARQSPRKQIDGAIVLAAMIGDANTPAAGLLKAHGLTFEEAIRALQRANADQRARAQIAAPQPQAPSTPPPSSVMSPSVMSPEPMASDSPVSEAVVRPPPQRLADRIPAATPVAKSGPSTEELLASVRARIQEQEPPKPMRPAVKRSAPAPAEPADRARVQERER